MRVPDPESLVWLNGQFLPAGRAQVPLDAYAVQAGMGVFETLAVRDGRLLDLRAHLERLHSGAERLGVPEADNRALVEAMRKVASSLGGSCGWLKVIAGRTRTLGVFGGLMDPADVGRPATAVLLKWRLSPVGPISGLKTLNYAPYVLGTEEAVRRGADEGIWCNTRGHLAEGCSSNVVVVRRNTCYTPGIRDGVLPGTVRDLALRAARSMDLPVHEGKIRLVRLERADEAFLTSSLRGVRPLVQFQGKPVGDGSPGPVTRSIAGKVERMRVVDEPPGAARGENGPEDATLSGDSG